GGRGIHVFVPVSPEWDFVAARRATIAIGRELERRLPDQVTTKWWKEERGAKIFVDYNQMARDRTIASAYSIRANQRATVSAPLRWEELGDVHPDDFDVLTMPARFAEVGDLFAPLRADRDDPGASPEPALQLSRRDEAAHGLSDRPYPPEYPKMPGEPKRVQPSKYRDRRATRPSRHLTVHQDATRGPDGGHALVAGVARARLRSRDAGCARQDVGEVIAHRLLELLVRARGGVAVLAPATELRRVPEPVPLHLVVRHLEDALGSQRRERQVLPRAPARHGARHPLPRRVLPPGPRVRVRVRRAGLDDERRELRDECRPALLGERRGDADELELPRVVVQPEQERAQQRALRRRRLVQAVPREHDVRLAPVLDLEHRALVRLVRPVQRLRDDPVEPRALDRVEPVTRHRDVPRAGRRVHGRAVKAE